MEKKVITGQNILDDINKKDNVSVLEYKNVIIENILNLTNITIKQPLKFINCTFKDEIKVIYSTFKESVEFENCTFEQEVNFGDCEQAHTVFEKSVNFKECTFESTFLFVGVIVKGMADFEKSIFEKEVNFLCAKFERALFMCNTKFHNKANFKSMNVASYARFDKMKCSCEQSKIDFTGSSFGDKVTFKEICCKSELILIAVNVYFFNFSDSKFYNTLDVRYISCSVFLCEKVEFRGKVDFDSTHIKLTLNLDGSKIYDDFSLKSVGVHQVHFNIDVKSDGKLDLRGFKFEVMKDSVSECDKNRLLRLFNENQNEKKFSRDPYIELESFYRARGRIQFADEVHYNGKSQLREYAIKKDSSINMSRTEKCLDWIVKTLTGYGTKNKRLLFILLGVIAFGAVIFGIAGAAPLAPEGNVRKAIYYTAYATDLLLPVDLGLYNKDNNFIKEEKSTSTERKFIITRITERKFTITEQLPEEKESLSGICYLFIELLSSFYIALGWLLIPLALASFTGLLSKGT
jgi:hypothetical protein